MDLIALQVKSARASKILHECSEFFVYSKLIYLHNLDNKINYTKNEYFT